MTPIDEKTQKTDGPDKGGYADIAQPKPEIPDLVPHKPEIDHTDTDGVDRKDRDPGTIYMAGGKKTGDAQIVPERNQSDAQHQSQSEHMSSQEDEGDAAKDVGQRQTGGRGQQQSQQQSPAPRRT
jgi:hypothetical protein